MAVQDVLDQRQAKAGSTLRPALADIDAVEALGQPRQMLGRDARSVVTHRHHRLTLAAGLWGRSARDIDALAARAVFQAVFDQVLEQPRELVAIAEHDERRRRRRDLDLNAAVLGESLQA